MNQPAEHIPTEDLGRRRPARLLQLTRRCGKRQRTVRPLIVVVRQVLPQDPLKVTATNHQELVQALGADGPHEPFGEGVGAGGTDRGPYPFIEGVTLGGVDS